MNDFGFVVLSVGLALSLFVLMLILLEAGRRLGVRRARTTGGKARAGVGVVDAAVYSLLALLIGFTFSGAAQRFDQRRALVGEAANAASTAWKRVDILPDDLQPPVRTAFRHYMDELIAFYAESWSSERGFQPPATMMAAEDDLWSRSVAACKAPNGEPARMLLLPSLNELFDEVDRELVARRIHPPVLVFVMLGIAALASALFAGYGMASGTSRNWIYTVGIAATVSVATYVIIELEYPRIGLVRVSPMDQVLVELRQTLK